MAVNQFFRWLGNLFRPKMAPVKAEVIGDEKINYESIWSDRDRYIQEMRKRLLYEDNDLVLIQTINGHIELFSSVYRRIGTIDGEKGTRDFYIKDTAKAHATQLVEHINSTLTGRVMGIRRRVDEKEKNLEEKRSGTAGLRTEYRMMERKETRHFSSVLAVTYIVFAAAMILADIAISLNLVNYFGIGNIKSDASFWDKVGDPELFLFSLGVAFCTVYVKIIYDEYVNNRMGSHQEEMSRLKEMKLEGGSLKREWWSKLVIRLVILGLLCFLLYNLALYRTTFTLYASILTDQLNAIRERDSHINKIMLDCFIGLTVVIPIISGICLSVGLQIISNRRYRKKLRDRVKNSEDELQELNRKIEEDTSRLYQFQNYLIEWNDKEKKVILIAGLFNSSYWQGFKLGYRTHFGRDFYQLIEEYHNEYLHRKFV